ncbi:hypothetical protein E8E13_003058 [Curvularia kusanoi]|uniref:Uncharacterized protein n=1 Tax=Curvularia kusanoi TaxID=90978 RepID=A0A9P4T4T3_CURKU|nr:hypothetical protein E8E13_003058 [Curvularia kusanoi]
MVTPSFAKATRSSTLRASPGGSKQQIAATSETPQSSGSPIKPRSPTPGKQLKRPSTLTRRARESIAYNADLHFIKPANPSKLCPLAALPSELRSLIYTHVFGDLQKPVFMNYGRVRHSPVALLQICRAVRIEAAYMYYAEASFTWIVRNLNFASVMRWLGRLQPSHRALLARNHNLTIEIIPELRKSYTYPPKDFLLDDYMSNHWKACQPFGNLYTVTRIPISEFRRNLHAMHHDPEYFHSTGKVFFILFCRLAAWSRLCTQPPFSMIEWKYTFDLPDDQLGRTVMWAEMTVVKDDVYFFLSQLKRSWTRTQCEDRIRQPIVRMFDAFLKAIGKLDSSNGSELFPNMEDLNRLRDSIERWER